MSDASVSEGTLLWQPSLERAERSRLRGFERFLKREHGLIFASYEELWRWSVSEPGAFWRALADFFEVRFHTEPGPALQGKLPHASWFAGGTLNYAEHAFRAPADAPALVFRDESGRRVSQSYGELRAEVARLRAGLVKAGVGRGDRVAALLPNRPETLALLLATASLGAIWSSCAPEFGVGSVLDRFRQIEPKVFVTVDGYRYGGKTFDKKADVLEIARGLPGATTFVLSELGGTLPNARPFAELREHDAELAFEAVPFDHPLWILYSSGTTGLPKPIVQGHGGILLEHLKALALHGDLGEGDRFFWFTTTGWMMWNFLASGLLVGSTLVLYDGSPAHPGLDVLWRLAAEEGVTYFGTSAPYLLACKKARITPGAKHDLGRLRAIGTTGAPLPADGFAWVYEAVARDVLLASISGGTDVCTAFVLSCPVLPVHAGEIQCRGLGAKVEAFDAAGRSVTDQVGELVLTEPLPSMPVSFWGDSDGSRLHDAYFSTFPGVWRHGDWIKITPRGGSVIYGRSDSTLNRGGVRMGTSEFYRVVEALPEIADSLVVDTSSLENDAVGKLWLFVVPAAGVTLEGDLVKRIKETVRRELSPRHVPDAVRAVRAVSRTLNGKKLEVPVKRILIGVPLEQALSRDTLADPSSIDAFVALAAELARG
ncbi:MAG TPA: acetoacetate--CoA ligase [Polyangiaceae bacterium]